MFCDVEHVTLNIVPALLYSVFICGLNGKTKYVQLHFKYAKFMFDQNENPNSICEQRIVTKAFSILVQPAWPTLFTQFFY